ncbi:hypothetical protein [Solwaraspora sp. WMMA2065]|uniref:hypothetical protein n=1 Tax=Solwaraspora sp. WMMA2065 TaxID=3015166 RepID=UPI00259B2DF8|nr:hypothetical protein [Solwaraspora sp. WMMA2065]WJK36436.1 hypothetical protein O7610_08815 [Solwaraspora sp. WMMA2065]
MVQTAGAVADRVDRQPVVFGQDAADPHGGGHLVMRTGGKADKARLRADAANQFG